MPQQVADYIHALGVIWRESLAIFPILCYTNHRKAVRAWLKSEKNAKRKYTIKKY